MSHNFKKGQEPYFLYEQLIAKKAEQAKLEREIEEKHTNEYCYVSKSALQRMLNNSQNNVSSSCYTVYDKDVCLGYQQNNDNMIINVMCFIKDLHPEINKMTLQYIKEQLDTASKRIDEQIYDTSMRLANSVVNDKDSFGDILKSLLNQYELSYFASTIQEELFAIERSDTLTDDFTKVLTSYLQNAKYAGFLPIIKPYLEYDEEDDMIIKRLQNYRIATYSNTTTCTIIKNNMALLKRITNSVSQDIYFSVYKELVAAKTSEHRITILLKLASLGKKSRKYTKNDIELVKSIEQQLVLDGCRKCKAFKQSHYEQIKSPYGETNQVDDRRLTKLEARAYFWYSFLCDKRGMACNVDLVEASKVIKCCPKSLMQATKNLQRLGYISYSALHNQNKANHIQVLVLDRKKCGLPAAQGGKGYIVLSKNLFERIVSINDVLELRMVLKALLEDDAQNITVDNNATFEDRSSTTLGFKDAILYLGNYLYDKKVISIFNKITPLFDVHIDSNSANVKLKNDYNGKYIRSLCNAQYINMAEELREEYSELILEQDDLQSVADLCRIYTRERVVEGLQDIRKFILEQKQKFIDARAEGIEFYYKDRSSIKVFGAYLCDIIKSNIRKEKIKTA